MQNYISATDESGKRFNLFTPLAPYETLDVIREICDEFNRTVGEGKIANNKEAYYEALEDFCLHIVAKYMDEIVRYIAVCI